MIYITGDKHGEFYDVISFCYKNNTTLDDILIILGDAGFNYYRDYRDNVLKNNLSDLPITLFCIRGNHEERPENIPTYREKTFHNGIVYYEEDHPNILFAKDGEVFDFNGFRTMVIGGAYSIDKDYRIKMGYPWYQGEQLNKEEQEAIKAKLATYDNKMDIILTHTCPYKYMPYESFVGGIDEKTVDKSTEIFLDDIENTCEYQKWYCGHFHADKVVDKIEFMMHNIQEFHEKEKRLVKTK